jgi:enoyl-CoA hydratase/carnithine racemase
MKKDGGYEFLTIEKSEGVAILTLNRPDRLNAIHAEAHAELETAWLEIAADEEVRAVVFTGAGKAFSAGGDVRRMAERAGTEEGLKYSLKVTASGRRLFQNMLEVPQPIVCAVNGDAVGLGATLALFSDIAVVSETARLGDTHVRVGLVAGDGGAVIWPLLVGPSRAKEFLMRGRLVTGKEAREMGLVSYAVPESEVVARAMELARELAALPVRAVQWTKLSVNKWLKDQLNLVLDASLAFEALSMHTQDHAEAARAFLEKRRPAFKGY